MQHQTTMQETIVIPFFFLINNNPCKQIYILKQHTMVTGHGELGWNDQEASFLLVSFHSTRRHYCGLLGEPQ